ncbi:MAG TPA: Rieske 2Fe-2S domain-containing protein, partial [Acidimicrobiia bacterium]|nr:Rieske 2Fe-2S domain-containing protein [Acidimicrobiia bacterium]
WCQTSQWFECPCHGSKYSRVGEKKGGPAPRGLDRFPIDVSGDTVTINTGIVALYQRCVHLGCRVPFCQTSQWFECPCHGSKYNRVGEKKAGPAPRGLDRFYATQSGDGSIVVDTGNIFLGPPIGTNTTGQEAEGPNCV